MSSVTALRLALRAAGYSPLPVDGKKPVVRDWPALVKVSKEEIESWLRDWPRATNTGILTRRTPA